MGAGRRRDLPAAFVGGKWLQRRRFYRSLRMARISVNELKRPHRRGRKSSRLRRTYVQRPRTRSQRIPGAVAFDLSMVDAVVAELPGEREVILYCNCPSEASAARIARLLMNRGVRLGRPLTGGLQAWLDAGFEADSAGGERTGRIAPRRAMLGCMGTGQAYPPDLARYVAEHSAARP